MKSTLELTDNRAAMAITSSFAGVETSEPTQEGYFLLSYL